MDPRPCPSCSRSVRLPEAHEGIVSFCPVCGQCMQAPSDWSAGRRAGAPRVLAPAPGGSRVGVGLLIGGGFLAAVCLGYAFFGARTNSMQLVGGLAGALMLLCVVALAVRKIHLSRPHLDAVPLELSPELPPEVFDLGPPAALYQTESPLSALVLILVGLIFLALGGVGIHAVLHGRGAGNMGKLAYLGPIVGLLATVLGLRNLLWRVRVVVFTEGFVQLLNRRATVCRWEDVEEVYRNTEQLTDRRVRPICTVRLRDGGRLVFHGNRLERVEKLGELIERQTYPRLLPRARQTLEAGGTVPFGPLEVGPDGLVKGSQTLAWEEVADVRFDQGHVVVVSRDRLRSWCKVPASRLPNVPVFLTLARARPVVSR